MEKKPKDSKKDDPDAPMDENDLGDEENKSTEVSSQVYQEELEKRPGYGLTWYCYILRSLNKTNLTYVGMTNCVERRLK